jgi:hypothetical protein
MRNLWRARRRGNRAAAAADVAARKDKLSRLRPIHVDPDDDRPTSQDKAAEKAARRPGTTGGPSL